MAKRIWNKRWATLSSRGPETGVVSIDYKNRGTQTRDVKILSRKTFETYEFSYRKFYRAYKKRLMKDYERCNK
jgi:hypothetical protein